VLLNLLIETRHQLEADVNGMLTPAPITIDYDGP
jgi:hypothetical protein